MSCTIALVDDHPLYRQGLRSLLSNDPELQVVSEAGDARAACALGRAVKPGMVVMDVSLPDGDGIAAGEEIMRASPQTRVMALTMQASEFFVSRALAAGLRGYALKTQQIPEILEAIRTVAAGGTYVPQRFSHLMAQDGQGNRGISTTPFEQLSRREREIFELILRGFSNDQLAGALFISVKTVETHRAHINRKLNVHSTGELIRLAALHGLLGPS